jgi:hypothetical protein
VRAVSYNIALKDRYEPCSAVLLVAYLDRSGGRLRCHCQSVPSVQTGTAARAEKAPRLQSDRVFEAVQHLAGNNFGSAMSEPFLVQGPKQPLAEGSG